MGKGVEGRGKVALRQCFKPKISRALEIAEQLDYRLDCCDAHVSCYSRSVVSSQEPCRVTVNSKHIEIGAILELDRQSKEAFIGKFDPWVSKMNLKQASGVAFLLLLPATEMVCNFGSRPIMRMRASMPTSVNSFAAQE